MAHDVRVAEADAGMRLDVFLARRVGGLSRTRARRLIEDGEVRRNGHRPRKGDRVAVGDRISLLRVPPPADVVPVAQPDLELRIVHRDNHIVVVDKPAGLPTHPLRADETGTLANALIARFPEMAGVGYALREPGILHRLDNDTSGLLLAARDKETFDTLRGELRRGRMDKRYDVLIDGILAEMDEINAPICKHPSDPRRVHVCLDPNDRRGRRARPACTEILERDPVGSDLMRLRVRAGVAVRHQIRAHFAATGHPLVGDWLYGGAHHEQLGRHFLHACALGFTHPASGERVSFTSPLPPELAGFVERHR